MSQQRLMFGPFLGSSRTVSSFYIYYFDIDGPAGRPVVVLKEKGNIPVLAPTNPGPRDQCMDVLK